MDYAPRRKKVKVVVLGDIGRSPRMQYHSLSLANNGLDVDIIGYADTSPLREILEHEHIKIIKLHPLLINKGPKILKYVIKTLWQSFSLLLTLLISGSSDYLLCQNPPAIPTLPICRFYCLITRSKFIIDWHNYAYTIMGLTLDSKHPLLRFARVVERYFGRSSDYNICVTYAMKNDLIENWDIQAKVLYDRPPQIFSPLRIEEKHDWFLKISQTYPEFGCYGKDKLNLPSHKEPSEQTSFTQLVVGNVEARQDRPGLLFSSTSWTPDEDFSLLLEALQVYENSHSSKKLPKLICVITGKGPMKTHYIDQIASRNWIHVKVVTPWLESADYPKMVASADLGVCLHTSSSGLDLPMKVVDMFGAGLPVCACDYECLEELVENNKNGYTFKSSQQLAKQIIQWFEYFPNNKQQNEISDKMRAELLKFQESRWEDNWKLRVKEYFE